MLVSIGSRNPAKVKGVVSSFSRMRRFFPSVSFAEVDVTGAVRAQPMTLEETRQGAIERARLALRGREADFGVGVEAGLFACGDDHLDLQIAVIMDGGGRSSTGSSCGFMLPRRTVERMVEEHAELDRFAHELTGQARIREEHGVVYHLTGRTVSRVQMTEQCVTMALIPWVNRKLYGFD